MANNEQQLAAVYNFIYGLDTVPRGNTAELGWKAVKAIATGDGKLSEPERTFLLGKMCAVMLPAASIEAVMAWDEHSSSAVELLKAIDVPEAYRRGAGAWMVYEGLSVSLADGEIAPGELASVHEIAKLMGLKPEEVEALHKVVEEEAAVRKRRIATLFSTINNETFRFHK